LWIVKGCQQLRGKQSGTKIWTNKRIYDDNEAGTKTSDDGSTSTDSM
jgi:hypothetical protein